MVFCTFNFIGISFKKIQGPKYGPESKKDKMKTFRIYFKNKEVEDKLKCDKMGAG